MSFTKNTFNDIIASISEIQIETLENNDLTICLEMLNSLLTIRDSFNDMDQDLVFFWNEIVSDSIAILYAGISGNYRLAMAGLRSVLETACHAFYYLDHKVELRLFINENWKADKYVSSLINEHSFFTTKYIRTFYPSIAMIETTDNAVSQYLMVTYQKLCDIVHGRYNSLTKQRELNIQYSKEVFSKFKASFGYTTGAIFCMYVLRTGDFSDGLMVKTIKRLNIMKL